MPRLPAARARPAPMQRRVTLARPVGHAPEAVSLAALAVPDQLTVGILYQWLHDLHTRLVPLHHDPSALQGAVAAALAQQHWPTLFHAVQQLGATQVAGSALVQDAVLHALRNSFATLAGAMELVVAGDWGTEHTLLGLVQDHLDTLDRLIPDLMCLHSGGRHLREPYTLYCIHRDDATIL